MVLGSAGTEAGCLLLVLLAVVLAGSADTGAGCSVLLPVGLVLENSCLGDSVSCRR